jgi:hypothetical protein
MSVTHISDWDSRGSPAVRPRAPGRQAVGGTLRRGPLCWAGAGSPLERAR